MWGGTHFYVHIDALILTSPVGPSQVEGVPGKPQQCLAQFRQGEAAERLTSYPAALFFLQTLRATANIVHVMSEWSEADTTLILHQFGWHRYCADVRTLARQPRVTAWTAASAGCDPVALASSVFVVSQPSQWDSLLHTHMVHVNHSDDDGAQGSSPLGSRGLLYALCQCISLSEWRVRYPGTPVACSLSLSKSTVFNYCRFFVPDDLLSQTIAAVIAAHGGILVKTVREATHVLTWGEREAADDAQAAGTVSSSSSEETTDSEEASATSASSVSTSSSSAALSDADERENSSVTLRAQNLAGASMALAVADHEAAAGPLPNKTDPNLPFVYVTRGWINDCVRALRLLPPPVWGAMDETAEQVKPTGALLCAMLPPEDAKPLPFTHFLRLARHYQYPVGFLLDPDTQAPSKERILLFFKDLVYIITDAPAGAGGKAVKAARAGVDTSADIWLCRNERRRDRTAVSAHVRLLASQFVFSIAHLQEDDRQQRTAGTQTAAPLTAQSATNTELAELTPPSSPTPVPQPEVVAAPPSEAVPAAVTVERLEVSTEADWRSHLKNAEGKLLRRDDPEEDSLFLTGPTEPLPSMASSMYSPPFDGWGKRSIFSAPPTIPGEALLPPPSSGSLFAAPPLTAGSIFPAPPSAMAPSPVTEDETNAVPASVPGSHAPATAASETFTCCFIRTAHLPASEQESVLAFVRSLPFFAKCPSNTVERNAGGLRCQFATHGGAAYFASSARLRFRGHALEIVPVSQDAVAPQTWTVHATPSDDNGCAEPYSPAMKAVHSPAAANSHRDVVAPAPRSGEPIAYSMVNDKGVTRAAEFPSDAPSSPAAIIDDTAERTSTYSRTRPAEPLSASAPAATRHHGERSDSRGSRSELERDRREYRHRERARHSRDSSRSPPRHESSHKRSRRDADEVDRHRHRDTRSHDSSKRHRPDRSHR